MDLFGDQPDRCVPARRHDAGGRVKTKLPEGIVGRAHFAGERDEHRIWLWRGWGEAIERELPYVLLIGMNPSTADKDHNDPTITREIGFVMEWGYQNFYKGNVGSYRATKQKELLNPDLQIVHPDNFTALRALANSPLCGKIVLGCGVVPKTLISARNELVQALRSDGHTIWCFGLTDSGHPKHPLFLRKGTPLEELRIEAGIEASHQGNRKVTIS